MKRKIVTNPKELRKRSITVSLEEAQDIIKELEENLDTSKGIGLSAIQIGIPKRVGIIRISQHEGIFLNLVNAKIVEKFDKFRFFQEGCLSLPGIKLDTIRYKEIVIENEGKKYSFDIETDNILCIAIQHELSHFNGRTIIDDKWRKR